MADGLEPQGVVGMRWGARAKMPVPEKTAEEIEREELIDQIQSIYENACFADGNQPGFYYREYEDVGLLAVYQAGLEAGKQEKN